MTRSSWQRSGSILCIWGENHKPNFAVLNVNRTPCPGNAGVFFYLMDTGVITGVPAPRGYDERYVLLNDASFFEVSGPLSAVDFVGAVRLRGVYRARSRVLRIVYAISVDERSVDTLAQQVSPWFLLVCVSLQRHVSTRLSCTTVHTQSTFEFLLMLAYKKENDTTQCLSLTLVPMLLVC